MYNGYMKNAIHYKGKNPTVTQCGVTVWEAIKVTANHGQVTCPECSKLIPQTAYQRAA